MKNIIKGVLRTLLPAPIKAQLRKMQNRWEIKAQAAKYLRPTDVFVVGHPKSGNTWVAYMLAVILSEKADKTVTMGNVYEFVPSLHNKGIKVKDFEHVPSPRIFRHENPAWHDFYPRTIYLVRDPRAVLLSYYHHWLKTDRSDHGTLEEFVDEILEHGCIRRWEPWLIRWDVQVKDWLNRTNRQLVKIVRYEDLIESREKVFRDIVLFAGLSYDENQFSQAVERGSFENMQRSEKQHGAEAYLGVKGKDGFFVRKGRVDSWREEMPIQTVQKIEAAFQHSMKTLGYL